MYVLMPVVYCQQTEKSSTMKFYANNTVIIAHTNSLLLFINESTDV